MAGARSYLLACLALTVLFAGCVQEPIQRGPQTIITNDPGPHTVTAVTGHAVQVSGEGADGLGGEPVDRDPVHATPHKEALWECIAWPQGAETLAPYGPPADNASSVRRDPACRAEDGADQGWTTDQAVLFGDGLPGGGSRDGPFFVAAVERGDCSPATGSAFDQNAYSVVFHAQGYRTRTVEVRYTCAETGIEEWLYLTKSGLVSEPDGKILRPTSWTLGIDTCDDAHYPSDDARGVCTDGAAHRFDDTSRGVILHRGTGADGTPHRASCRNIASVWYVWEETAARGPCQDEHHFTADVDVYFFDLDPTGGLWE